MKEETKTRHTRLAVLAVLLCVSFTAIFTSCGKKMSGQESDPPVQAAEREADTEPLEKWQEGTIFYNGKSYQYNAALKSYLFMGIDKDEKVRAVPDGIDGGQCDALFLLVVDEKKARLSLIKIHRNTMTEVDVYDEDGTHLGPMELQLCLQHGYGDGARLSCSRTVAAVEKLFYNIPIKGYFAMNMGGIRALNDAVGGVSVEVLEDVSMPELGVSLKEGEQVTLDGDEAYAYVRKRDIAEFDSATGRMERQSQYLSELIPMLQDMGESKANGILEELDDYVVSDIIYLDLLEETGGLTFSDADIYTVPGETVLNGEFEEYHVDEDAFYEMILDIFYERV